MKYASNSIEINFKGNTKIGQVTDYVGKTLNQIVYDNIGLEKGYYFFGISIGDAFHSAIIGVDNTDPSNPRYGFFDQRGERLSIMFDENQEWLSGEQLDEYLLKYFEGGLPTTSGGHSKVNTYITPIHEKQEN